MHTPEIVLPSEELKVPDSLLPSQGKTLPHIDLETLEELRANSWKRLGIMVPFIDSDMNLMMLKHNGRDKNSHGALGPLGETSQHSGVIIEQPLETLFRGMVEELGVERPQDLDLWMHGEAGWMIHQWPHGINAPGEYSCAITFPVFVTDVTKYRLLSQERKSEEVHSIEFLPPPAIKAMDKALLRPGIDDWLSHVEATKLLMPGIDTPLKRIDFSELYRASLQDIEL
jgi:hypothetical protein